MLSSCLLRSIARAAPGRGSLLLLSQNVTRPYPPRLRRDFASTRSLLRNESSGPDKGPPMFAPLEKAPAPVINKPIPLASITKTPNLLGEPTLTTQEQRKADWGIIKEMSTYLWPKVRFLKVTGVRC